MRPSEIVAPLSPAPSPEPSVAAAPLWPVVLVLAAIADRMEREGVDNHILRQELDQRDQRAPARATRKLAGPRAEADRLRTVAS